MRVSTSKSKGHGSLPENGGLLPPGWSSSSADVVLDPSGEEEAELERKFFSRTTFQPPPMVAIFG